MRKLLILNIFLLFYQVNYGQNVGIGTSNPDTELHLHDPSGDNIISQKITTPLSETEFGFNINIGAILGTVTNHDLRIRTNEFSRIVVGKDGKVGIGSGIPTEKLHVENGNIFLSNLGGTNTKGLLFGESNEPVYGWIYDGLGSGSNNKLVLREYLGTASDLLEINGDGKMKLSDLEGNSKRALFVEPDGTIIAGPEEHYYSGSTKFQTEYAFENLHLPEGAKLQTIEFRYLDDADDAQLLFFVDRRAFTVGTSSSIAFSSSGDSFNSPSIQTRLLNFSTSENPINNKDFYYSVSVIRDEGVVGNGSELRFISYRIKYTFE